MHWFVKLHLPVSSVSVGAAKLDTNSVEPPWLFQAVATDIAAKYDASFRIL
jgi:hypothetical protein